MIRVVPVTLALVASLGGVQPAVAQTPTPLSAQRLAKPRPVPPPSPVSAITAVGAYLTSNGSFANFGPQITTRIRFHALPAQGCTLAYVSADSSWNSDARDGPPVSVSFDTVEAELGALTPDVDVDSWANGEAWEVNFRSSTTTTTIRMRGMNMYEGTPMPMDTAVAEAGLAFNNEAVARTAGRLIATAIQTCGGHPETPSARAAELKRRGKDPATLAALTQCHGAVRNLPNVPSSVRFQGSPLIAPLAGDLMISGKVEAPNQLGGTVAQTYICTFERSGDGWVLKNAPVFLPAQ